MFEEDLNIGEQLLKHYSKILESSRLTTLFIWRYKMKENNEISYDFSSRLFDFICKKNNNIAQFYLLSNQEKNKIYNSIQTSFIEILRNK